MTVTVVPHRSEWASIYARESAHIRQALEGVVVACHHIGSTAVPGLIAKPIVDILVEATSIEEVDRRRAHLEAIGYEAKGAYGIPGRRYFRKATPSGVRLFHLHAFAHGAEEAEQHLAVRDYFRSHPEVASEYSELKRALTWQRGANKRTYVAGKSPFVERVVQEATAWKRSC